MVCDALDSAQHSQRDQSSVEQLKFGNCALEEVSNQKHLGVILQNNCKWDDICCQSIRKQIF